MKTVVVSPMLPNPQPDNAGGHYLLHLTRALGTDDVLFVVPETARSLEAARDGGPRHILVPQAPGRIPTLTRRIRQLRRILWPVSPAAGFAAAIRRHPEIRLALATADVVDVQWEDTQLVLPTLRRLAPNARFVLTFHDVVSQQKSRELLAAKDAMGRIRAALGLLHARWLERRSHRWADELVVLSEKDRAILPYPDQATIIYPPVAEDVTPAATSIERLAGGGDRVLFVGPLWRETNREAVEWLVGKVWPIVRREMPDAQLLVAGTLPDEIVPLVPQAPGVTYAGFVDDLDALYDSSAVLAAPLLQGAGVKFKVLEAIARGVPTALTSVAAEGIGDAAFTPCSDDSATGFAEQVLEALRDPSEARNGAGAGAEWAKRRYGWEQFVRRVQAVYGPADFSHDPVDVEATRPRPPITVVVPARDGATTLPDQLDSIAREPEAGEIEIVVSDNGSRDRTIAVSRVYASLFGSLRVIDSSAVAGVGPARNAGARAARADRVVFLDTDDEIRPGFIGAIRRALETADAAAGLPITGRLGPAERDASDLPEPLRRAPFGTLKYGVGCVLSVRTDVLFALEGFDESFHEGHEEVDFCWRLQLAGHTLVGVPDAAIDYRQRPTVRSSFRQFRRYSRSAEQLRSRYVRSLELPVASTKRAIRLLLRTLRYSVRDVTRYGQIDVARRLGWAVGGIEGTIKYRER